MCTPTSSWRICEQVKRRRRHLDRDSDDHLSSCHHPLTHCMHSSNKGTDIARSPMTENQYHFSCHWRGCILTLALRTNHSREAMWPKIWYHNLTRRTKDRRSQPLPGIWQSGSLSDRPFPRWCYSTSQNFGPYWLAQGLISPNWWLSPGLYRYWWAPDVLADEGWYLWCSQSIDMLATRAE